MSTDKLDRFISACEKASEKADEQDAERARREEERRARKAERTRMRCPRCKSTNIQVVGANHKGFSVGKAVGGAVLFGGVGTIAGLAGKDKGTKLMCMDCGHTWVKK